MNKRFKNIIKSFRLKEYSLATIIQTIIGMLLTKQLSLLILPLLAANIVFHGSFFVFNSIEDVEEDKKDPLKKDNPISNGFIKRNEGLLLCFLLFCFSFILYLIIKPIIFILFLIIIPLVFLYSWRPVRLKFKPPFDLIVHSICPAVLALFGYLIVYDSFNFISVLFFLIITLISLSSELINEIRDYEVDKKSGFKTSSNIIGIKNSYLFLKISNLFSIVLGIYLFFILLNRYFVFWLPVFLLSLIPLLIPINKAIKENLLANSWKIDLYKIIYNKSIFMILTLFIGLFIYFII